MQENKTVMLTPEIVRWLSSKLKPKSCDYIVSQNREVYIKKPNSNAWHVVEIPQISKDSDNLQRDSELFQHAWLKVFMYAKNYLETEVKILCLDRNYVLTSTMPEVLTFGNQIQVGYEIFNIPKEEDIINYMETLDKIVSSYKNLTAKAKKTEGVNVHQSSVTIGREEPVLSQPQVKEEPKTQESASLDLVIRKVTDDYALDDIDFSKFREDNVDLLFIPCQDWKRKSDRLFVQNVERCKREGFSVGTFVYGKAIDDDMIVNEVKKVYELLDRVKDSITNLVIYAVDDNYIKDNADDETKMIKFIEMYLKFPKELNNFGYETIISMDINSKKIIDDVVQKFDLVSDIPVIYTVMPKEKENVSSDESVIVIDPREEHDDVVIKNENLIRDIDNQILNKQHVLTV